MWRSLVMLLLSVAVFAQTRTFTPTLRQNSPNPLTIAQVDGNFSGTANIANSATRSYFAASQAAMLALSPVPQAGDWCWRTDTSFPFMFKGGDATNLANWSSIPTYPVTSVFGRTGVVAAQSGDYSVAQVTGALASATLADTSSSTAGDYLVGVKQLYTGAVGTTQHEVNARSVSVKDFGAKGDGITDDTTAIQDAINAVGAQASFSGEYTGRALYFPMGVYKITSPLVLSSNCGVSLLGDGKTKSNIWQATTGQDVIQASGNNFRAVISGLRLTGNVGGGGISSAALRITGSGNQIDLRDNWITTLGYAIYGNPHSDCVISGNVVEYVYWPIYMLGGGNGYFTITGNTFYNCGPVSLGGAEQQASFSFTNTEKIIFANNKITSDTAMSPQSGGFFVFSGCQDVVFTGNNMAVNDVLRAVTMTVGSVTGINISNNVFPGSYKSQINFTSSSRITLANNIMPDRMASAVAADMVLFSSCSDFTVSGNTFGKSSYIQLNIVGCSGFSINGDVFDGGSDSAIPGVVVTGAGSSWSLTGNTFRNPNSATYDLSADTTTGGVVAGNAWSSKGYTLGAGSSTTTVVTGGVPLAGSPIERWVGATPGTGTSQTFTTWKTGAVLQGYAQVTINGSAYWLPYYSAPTGP